MITEHQFALHLIRDSTVAINCRCCEVATGLLAASTAAAPQRWLGCVQAASVFQQRQGLSTGLAASVAAAPPCCHEWRRHCLTSDSVRWCVLQQRHGISNGLASSVSSSRRGSRTAAQTRSRNATQTRRVHVHDARHRRAQYSGEACPVVHNRAAAPSVGARLRYYGWREHAALAVCVTTETRPLDQLAFGQLGEFEQDSNTDSELESNTDSHTAQDKAQLCDVL